MALLITASILLAIFIGWGTGSLAGGKGRDPAAWFLLGFFLGPVPFVVALVMDQRGAIGADAR
jgi:hypothetical protein